jgi:hypothetical protein
MLIFTLYASSSLSRITPYSDIEQLYTGNNFCQLNFKRLTGVYFISTQATGSKGFVLMAREKR